MELHASLGAISLKFRLGHIFQTMPFLSLPQQALSLTSLKTISNIYTFEEHWRPTLL